MHQHPHDGEVKGCEQYGIARTLRRNITSLFCLAASWASMSVSDRGQVQMQNAFDFVGGLGLHEHCRVRVGHDFL
jgi:hypothetical protein